MARPYSKDLREKVIEAYNKNIYTKAEIAELFGVSHDFVNDMVNLINETGSLDAKQHKGNPIIKITPEAVNLIKELVAQDNDILLKELRQHLKEKMGIEVTNTAIHYVLQKENLTLKKKLSMQMKEKKKN